MSLKLSPAQLQGVQGKVFRLDETKRDEQLRRRLRTLVDYDDYFHRFASLGECGETQWLGVRPKRCVGARVQNGPNCGLVALTMAADLLLGDDEFIESEHNEAKLLEVARNLRFSRHGEMFSVELFCELVSQRFADDLDARRCILGDEHASLQNFVQILDSLLAERVVLIAYDSDKNHSPANLAGERAHWALLLGFLLPKCTCETAHSVEDGELSPFNSSANVRFSSSTSELESETHEQLTLLASASSPTLKVSVDLLDSNRLLLYDAEKRVVKACCCAGDILVVAQQSKSRHTQLWTLSTLLESNAQLNAVDSETKARDLHIPAGKSLRDTLASQFIEINRRAP